MTVHDANTQPNIPAVNPIPKTWRGKALLIGVSTLAVIIISVAIFKAILPGELSGGYLYSSGNFVMLLQITNNNGSLSGEAYSASKSNGNVSQFSTSLTGEENNSQLDISLSIFGFGSYNVHGTYDGRNLHLEIPSSNGSVTEVVLSPASIDDYNNAVHNLQQQAANDQATTTVLQATADAQQATASAQQTATAYTQNEQSAISNDASTISSDIQSMNSDADFSQVLQSYKTDLASGQKDYQTEQNDAKNDGCSSYAVSQDDYAVHQDAYAISQDDYSLNSQVGTANQDISTLQGLISDMQQHYTNLGEPNSYQNDQMVQAASNAISKYQSAISDAQNQGKSFDSQMQQLVSQADALEGCK